jgi:hypothetical protein
LPGRSRFWLYTKFTQGILSQANQIQRPQPLPYPLPPIDSFIKGNNLTFSWLTSMEVHLGKFWLLATNLAFGWPGNDITHNGFFVWDQKRLAQEFLEKSLVQLS